MKTSDIKKQAPVNLCDCGMAAATNLLSDRWTLLIVREAFYGVVRFDDIRNDIGIPKAVLSSRLKKLVADDIFQKVNYQVEGERTRSSYVLTDKGKDLGMFFVALMEWGNKHCLDGKSAVEIVDKTNRQPLNLRFVSQNENAKTYGTDEIAMSLSK